MQLGRAKKHKTIDKHPFLCVNVSLARWSGGGESHTKPYRDREEPLNPVDAKKGGVMEKCVEIQLMKIGGNLGARKSLCVRSGDSFRLSVYCDYGKNNFHIQSEVGASREIMSGMLYRLADMVAGKE